MEATRLQSCASFLNIHRIPLRIRGQQQMCRIARDFALATHGPQASGTPTALSRRRVSAWRVRSGVNSARTCLFVSSLEAGYKHPLLLSSYQVTAVNYLQILYYLLILGYDRCCWCMQSTPVVLVDLDFYAEVSPEGWLLRPASLTIDATQEHETRIHERGAECREQLGAPSRSSWLAGGPAQPPQPTCFCQTQTSAWSSLNNFVSASRL